VNDSVLWVADARIVKQVVNDRLVFRKPVELYNSIEVYGKVDLITLRHAFHKADFS
jgi:hypothetical protein